MKNIVKASFVLAVGLFGLSANSNAQTLIVGSSAFYWEAGLAAAAPTTSGGLGSTCIWNYGSNAVAVQDTSTGTTFTDSGSVWIAWAPGSDCSTTSSNSSIYLYLSTDSVVGVRALFNRDTLVAGSLVAAGAGGPTGLSGMGTIAPAGSSPQTVWLPSAIWSAINGAFVNTAATDIRPEDAEFAITRATTGCGRTINQYTGAGNTPTGSSSQYLGLGYYSGDSVVSYFDIGRSHVINFSLPSSFSVSPVGATPVLVAVNGNGWNGVTNLNRSTLALYLDGSIGNTKDAGSTASHATTVIVEGPLSGAYNVMEYNVPNNVELQTSQDVGFYQPTAAQNCYSPTTNPNRNTQGYPMPSLAGTKLRAIGSSQELSEVFSINNSLGYGFWSAGNFGDTVIGTRPKYLTIDGVDPLYTPAASTYASDVNQIPTSANGLLGDVTLANVANGTYPIWSVIRLVNAGSSASAGASALANAAGEFVSAMYPDFVPFNSLTVEHAHFTPPGIYAAGSVPMPQNYANGFGTEVGGDVGGIVIPYKVDQDFNTDTGLFFTGTQAPTSLRRN